METIKGPKASIRAGPAIFVDGEAVRQIQNDDLLIAKCQVIGTELATVDSLAEASVRGESNVEDLRVLRRPEWCTPNGADAGRQPPTPGSGKLRQLRQGRHPTS